MLITFMWGGVIGLGVLIIGFTVWDNVTVIKRKIRELFDGEL